MELPKWHPLKPRLFLKIKWGSKKRRKAAKRSDFERITDFSAKAHAQIRTSLFTHSRNQIRRNKIRFPPTQIDFPQIDFPQIGFPTQPKLAFPPNQNWLPPKRNPFSSTKNDLFPKKINFVQTNINFYRSKISFHVAKMRFPAKQKWVLLLSNNFF